MPAGPEGKEVLRLERPVEILWKGEAEPAGDTDHEVSIAREVGVEVHRIDRNDRYRGGISSGAWGLQSACQSAYRRGWLLPHGYRASEHHATWPCLLAFVQYPDRAAAETIRGLNGTVVEIIQ